MKKIILLAVLVLLMTSCSSKNPLNLKPKESVSAVTDKFSYETGKCLRDDLYVEYETLNRDDEIKIIDETDEHYFFDDGYVVLAVEKQYVRTEKEMPFEEYTGYAKADSSLYSDYRCSDKIGSFKLNDTVKVIDGFLDVLFVDADGVKGYMYASKVSRTKIQIYVAEKVTPVPEYNSDTNSNNTGGGSGSTPPSSNDSTPPSTDQNQTPSVGDGEDITLYQKPFIELLSSNPSVKGKVLADGVKAYLMVLNRGDVLKVISADETCLTVLADGLSAKVYRKYVRLDSEKEYKTWTAYTKGGSSLYKDFDLQKRASGFRVNEKVEVIDEVDGVFVVKTTDGSIGYMTKTDLSENEFKITIKPQTVVPETDMNQYNNEGSDNGGGSSSQTDNSAPSTDPAPAPDPEPEWTDPVL